MANQTIKNPNSIKNLFKEKFSSKLNVIYVNSLKREVSFKEISVAEQKSLSKTVIENETRRDIVYDTQCAMINHLCLESDKEQFKKEALLNMDNALQIELQQHTDLVVGTKEYDKFCQKWKNDYVNKYVEDHSFDIYKLTEFDRLRILMELYQNNYNTETVTFKCQNCGAENAYQLDFEEIINKLNEFDLSDKSYQLEDKNFIYKFTLNYPLVSKISQFYKQYSKHYKQANEKEIEVLDNLGNIEYINLYIKQIELIDKDNQSDVNVVDLSYLTYDEFEDLLATFPQNILFNENYGVIKYITTNFIDTLQNAFSYRKCMQCGHESTEGVGSPNDFL